jgi:hypothetical protein
MTPRFRFPRWPALVLACCLLGPARAEDEGTKVYQRVLKSVVWIHSPRGGGKLATGSGTLIDRTHRLVLTNFHVVGDNDRARVIFPIFRDGRLVAERDYYVEHLRTNGVPGRVVARDTKRDLALIQLERLPEGAEPLPLSPTGVSPGQTVHSVGNPGGSGALWVYTPGKVRQVYFKRWKADLDGRTASFEAEVVETDSPTNPGDSGGPLVNDQAQLVGVTQGGAVKAQLLSIFIDVSEVKMFLGSPAVRQVTGGDKLVPPRPATALIKDDGHFFSPEVVKKATEEIRDIARKSDRDLIIETYAHVPEDDIEKVKAMDREERDRYFRDWAAKRIKSEAINGVLILVSKEPRHLQVLCPPRLRSVFSEKDAQKLSEILLAKFRAKEYDEGLMEAIRFVREKLVHPPAEQER